MSETEKDVAGIIDSPKPPPQRITLTLPAINRARNVAFMVTGSSKQDAIKAIFGDDTCELPAAKVAGAVWLADEDAAAHANL